MGKTKRSTGRDEESYVRDLIQFATTMQNSSLMTGFVQALEAMLVARRYEDDVMIRASQQTAANELADAGRKLVSEVVADTRAMREGFLGRLEEKVWHPSGDLDEIGRFIERSMKMRMELLVTNRKIVNMCREMAGEFPEWEQLEAEIRETQRFLESTIGGWPWSDRPVLPLSPKELEEIRKARAALGPEDYIPVEDLIRKYGSTMSDE